MSDINDPVASEHEGDRFNLELSICDYKPCDLPSDFELVSLFLTTHPNEKY